MDKHTEHWRDGVGGVWERDGDNWRLVSSGKYSSWLKESHLPLPHWTRLVVTMEDVFGG